MNQADRPNKNKNLFSQHSKISASEVKKIGAILREADLVSIHQLDLALKDQANFPNLRLGEILARRGWIKSETADFFVQNWSSIVQEKDRRPLGYYLVKSALLEPKQIETILKEQESTGIRFGTIAVMQGLLKSTTLDFFLINLFPRESAVSPFVTMYGTMDLTQAENDEYLPPAFFEEWDDELIWQEYLKGDSADNSENS